MNSFVKQFTNIRGNGDHFDLSYFVRWHYPLWGPAVKWILDDPKRFYGKRVLEIGCRDGRMSCLFGLLGATVLGIELEGESLLEARKESEYWNLCDRVSFSHYNGDPLTIPGLPYDYVFTKSVLVLIPQLDGYLSKLSSKMANDGNLLIVENMSRGLALRRITKHLNSLIYRHRWGSFPYRNFRGVDKDFLASIRKVFIIEKFRQYYGVVAVIQARRK